MSRSDVIAFSNFLVVIGCAFLLFSKIQSNIQAYIDAMSTVLSDTMTQSCRGHLHTCLVHFCRPNLCRPACDEDNGYKRTHQNSSTYTPFRECHTGAAEKQRYRAHGVSCPPSVSQNDLQGSLPLCTSPEMVNVALTRARCTGCTHAHTTYA